MGKESALMAMLQGAKAVMDKVEGDKPSTPSNNNGGEKALPHEITESYLTEEQMAANGQTPVAAPKTMGIDGPKIVDGKGTYRNMEKSKMPDAIKKAMMESPIEQLTSPSHTFSLEDVKGMVNEAPVPTKKQPKRAVNPSINTKELVGLNENQVRKIVQEELLTVLAGYFTKSLTEQVQRKTIAEVKKQMKRKK